MCTVRYHEKASSDVVAEDIGAGVSRKQKSGGVKRLEGEFYEQVEIDLMSNSYERLQVPPLLSYKRSTVIHDFEKVNLSCFI